MWISIFRFGAEWLVKNGLQMIGMGVLAKLAEKAASAWSRLRGWASALFGGGR